MKERKLIQTLMVLLALSASTSFAAEKKAADEKPAPAADASAEQTEAVDVSKLQQKYWAQGKDTELGVVQNRKYTSAGRWEFAVLGGSISTDPFWSVHHYGASLGYHFSQYVSAHVIAWKDAVSPSSALTSYQSVPGAPRLATDIPKGFYGGQVDYNFLYGKASLFGGTIIYVDLFLLGGLGITSTETGSYFTPFLGLGQKIHLNQHMALDFDYRVMSFNEKMTNGSTRSNTTDAITLGLSVFTN